MSDFRTGLNLENFNRSAGAVLFFKGYHNFDSNKVCEIKLARVQYGSSDAINILLGALCQVKYVKSRTSLANLGVTMTTAPSRKCFCHQRITGSHLQCYSCWQEWAIIRRFEIARLLLSVRRAYLSAYDPIFSMTLRYLISIHKGFCLRQGISSPILDLTERLLLEERDPPPVPQESLYEARLIDKVDIQVLAHVVELTRQGAIDSLEFSKGIFFKHFRTKLNVELLDELVHECCVYRGLVEGGITSSFTSSFSLILFSPFYNFGSTFLMIMVITPGLLQVIMGRRLGVDEPLLMKLMRAVLHTHNEWFRLQMCKDLFEGLLKIDSLEEIKAPLIIDDISKKNTDNTTPGSSQMTTSSSNSMVKDGNSPTQVSFGDVICDEIAILKVMNGVQEKSMATVDKISDIIVNSPHKIVSRKFHDYFFSQTLSLIFIGGISEALPSNMLMEISSAFGILRAYRFQFYKEINGSCVKPSSKERITSREKVNYCQYMVHALLPILKQFDQEQKLEKALEARIQGNSEIASEIHLAILKWPYVLHISNFYRTSIADYHRSCLRCSYDFCLGCCQDVHSGCLQRVDGWKVKENGTISCPPKELGGCGCRLLELKFGDNDFSNKNLRKAARRECSGENYLYFVRIQDIQDSDQEHFQKYWINGDPVIVGDALDMASCLSRDPIILSRALREKKTSKVFKNQSHLEEIAIDCLLWSEVDHPIHDQTFYLTSEHKKKLHGEFGYARLFNEAA
ncbi:hypothetical protein GIB67_016835 [Kingdonia uniflora]|uniref:Uncharacterized protein n=1 Tax=Kingdonia uniflora TaxID=39325 RepID=A0A7J7LQ26_9MAGN|nr:hypothetical protein GIB67_016835 [Kingdonia uniflora]